MGITSWIFSFTEKGMKPKKQSSSRQWAQGEEIGDRDRAKVSGTFERECQAQ